MEKERRYSSPLSDWLPFPAHRRRQLREARRHGRVLRPHLLQYDT
jgi:hypothetical protein